MKNKHLSLFLFLLCCFGAKAQVNIKVRVTEVAVTSSQDCDPGGADNSDFLFEFRATDNSPFANSNNSPVAGSIGSCNYVYAANNNGPYTLTPAAPGTATFNPVNGLFFDYSYSCLGNIPTSLSMVWRAYENDDSSVPSLTAIGNGQIAVQANTFTVPAAAGTYSAQYTSTSPDGTCPQTYSIRFNVIYSIGSFSPLSIDAISGSTICTTASNGSTTATIIGGSGSITYDWSNDGTADFDDALSASGLTAGVYTLTVKDNLGCTDTETVSVSSQNPPTALNFSSPTSTICVGKNYGYSVGVQSNVSYHWSYTGSGANLSNGTNTATLSATALGSGTLSVYAQNSCSTTPTRTLAIRVNSTPGVSISGNSTLCANATATLVASGATTYSWSTTATTPSVTVAPPVSTTYTVTGTTAGCSAQAYFSLNPTPSPTVQLSSSTASVCPSQTVTVTATGNAQSYLWSDGYLGATHTFSNTASVVYTVTAIHANTCSSEITYTLHVNPAPVLSIAGSVSVCPNALASFTASGASSYTWSTGDNTAAISFASPSTTTLSVTGSSSLSCNSSQTFTVYASPAPTVAVTGNTIACSGDQVVLTASGADFYYWSTGATASTETITASTTTTISVRGSTIFTGCRDSSSIVIVVTPQPNIVIAGIDSLCSGQTALLLATGATSYTWSTGDNTASIVVSPTVTTSYTVSSSNGLCSDTKVHQVAVKPSPQILFSLHDVCVDEQPFTLNASPPGGAYSGPGVTGTTFDPQSAGVGIHTITYSVTNSYNCTAISQTNIQVQLCSDIAELTATIHINASPNPTNGLLQIESEAAIRLIEVVDLNGRLVALQELNAEHTALDLEALSPGVYLLRVHTEKGPAKPMRIMKQ